MARVVITPPLGVSLAGSYTDRRATELRDDLYARALVLDDGAVRCAIVCCDVIGLRAATVAAARRLIGMACGIPGDHVLIAATHNHTGPLARELAAGGAAGENDEPYLALLERQIASAVQLALHRAAPARLRLTGGEAQGIAFNRRFRMREGPVRTNPGKANAAIVEPAGPVDPRVWALTVLPPHALAEDDGAGSVPPNVPLAGVLVNYGLHPAIVAGTTIGADFPHFLEMGVGRLLGPDAVARGAGPLASPVVLFANAPCADINHIDVSHSRSQGGFAEAARVGTILAGEVVKAVCRLAPLWEGPVRLRAVRRAVGLPLRRPTPEQVAWARQAAGGRMTMAPGGGLEVVEAQRILALAEGWTGETHTTEIQILTLGDELAVVGLPGEIFAELGLDLRARSPFRHTLVISLANEAVGYVPTRRAYDEGGYEPTSSRFQPGSGEWLVEEALAILKDLCC